MKALILILFTWQALAINPYYSKKQRERRAEIKKIQKKINKMSEDFLINGQWSYLKKCEREFEKKR